MAISPNTLGLLEELSQPELQMLARLEARVDKQLREGTYKKKDGGGIYVVSILYYTVTENVRIALARKYREAGWSQVHIHRMYMDLTP